MTNIPTTTLRPGFLVSLKTSLTGNVTYSKRTIEADHQTDDGARLASWETERTIANAAEFESGGKARGFARTAITRVCSTTTFGFLCPEARGDELGAGIAEARRIAEEFNATATVSNLYVGVIVGRVAQDDAEAVRAINQEVRSLLDDMGRGIKNLDVAAVRDAANKARSLGQMLTPQAAERVQKAIDAARDVARRMVKAGEQAAQAVDAATLSAIASARTAFLDLDDAKEIGEVKAEPRGLDLEPEAPGTPAQPAAPIARLEF